MPSVPPHYVRFDRGFAMARTEVTVGEFRRFVAATGYQPRATRRGHSMAYDERSGNLVRRSGVDWRSRLRRPARRPTTCRCCTSARATPRPTREWLSAAERAALPRCPARRSSNTRCAPAARRASRGASGIAAARARATSPARCDRSPERPALAQRVRGLWRRLLGPGAGGPLSRPMHSAFTTWPAMSANGSPTAGTTATGARPRDGAGLGQPGLPPRAWCAAARGPARRRRRARPGAWPTDADTTNARRRVPRRARNCSTSRRCTGRQERTR